MNAVNRDDATHEALGDVGTALSFFKRYDRIRDDLIQEEKRLRKKQEELLRDSETVDGKILLLKKDLDQMVEESYLEVAAEKLGYKNIRELKKKLNIKP